MPDRATGIPGLDPSVGTSAYGFPGSAYVYDSTDGSFDGDFVGFMADPRCPTALNSDPLFPNSVIGSNPYGTICYFNFSAVAANEASLRRDSVMVNGNFDISDNVSAFARVTVNSSESFGRYAATPVTQPEPTISGSNPNNPYGGDARMLLRFVPGGNRDDTVRDRMFDVLFGLQGQVDWFGGADWEVAGHHNRYDIDTVGNGYVIRNQLQSLIDSGAYNPFGDPNDPGNLAAVAAASHTIQKYSETRYAGLDGQINFDLFEMANGPVGFAAGFDYRDERFIDDVDAQSSAGNVAGTAGGDAAGERAAYAVFCRSGVSDPGEPQPRYRRALRPLQRFRQLDQPEGLARIPPDRIAAAARFVGHGLPRAGPVGPLSVAAAVVQQRHRPPRLRRRRTGLQRALQPLQHAPVRERLRWQPESLGRGIGELVGGRGVQPDRPPDAVARLLQHRARRPSRGLAAARRPEHRKPTWAVRRT